MIAMLASMETLAGLLILIGGFAKDWMTRLAGLIVAVVMLVAIFMVHLEHGWNSVNMGSGNMGRGMEFQFTLTMIGLYFLAVGNGHQGSATV
jgi:putative oxidoreductase